MREPDGVLAGQIVISRIVQPNDDVIMVQQSGNLTGIESAGMLAMAMDSLLHPELNPDIGPSRIIHNE